MTRQCGGCTLCCKLLPVPPLGKKANTRCQHQSTKGCAVYHGPGMPRECALWNCRWLTADDTAGLRRPDRTGYVVDIVPDMIVLDYGAGQQHKLVVIQVWVDPARPDSWRDPALLAYAEARGEPLLVRFDSYRAITVFPPSLSPDGKCHVVEQGTVVQTRSGNMLFDQIRQ